MLIMTLSRGNRSITLREFFEQPADLGTKLRRRLYLSDDVACRVSLPKTRPLPTKDGGTLRTVAEARAYMLGLSKDRELRSQWQRAAELLLAEADVTAFSKAVELALFYDAKLDVAAS
jgi:hypothetical protein